MADNIGYTEGSGRSVATDQITSISGDGVTTTADYQRVKLVSGVDGVIDGDVSCCSPLPVAMHGEGRRLQEIMYLEVAEQDYRLMAANECYASNRRGMEIR